MRFSRLTNSFNFHPVGLLRVAGFFDMNHDEFEKRLDYFCHTLGETGESRLLEPETLRNLLSELSQEILLAEMKNKALSEIVYLLDHQLNSLRIFLGTAAETRDRTDENEKIVRDAIKRDLLPIFNRYNVKINHRLFLTDGT